MNVTSRFEAWYGIEVSELKHVSVESIRQRTGRCWEKSSPIVMRREWKREILFPSIVFATDDRSYLSSLGTEGAALEKKG